MQLPVILLGCGGHGRVLLDILNKCSISILGYTDHSQRTGQVKDIPYLGEDEMILTQYKPDEIILVNGLGSVGSTQKRRQLFERFSKKGYRFANVVDPSAVISRSVRLKEGAQVIAGAIVQTGTVIGENSIVNTKASVDHDCRVGAHVHIAPGATLSGSVIVEDGVHIGAGATVIQGIKIGRDSIVAAGAVVIQDVPPDTTVAGVPAKVVKR